MAGPPHEHAWAAALDEEHGHQRELLATLRDELGTFARECASALTALDTFAGLSGVVDIVSSAATDTRHAALVLEVGKRLGVGSRDQPLEDLYGKLGRGDDAPPALVRHASELLRQKEPRSDRQLLSAVVTASGAAAGVEAIVGPAPWAALAALGPLVRWAPMRRGDMSAADLSQVLDATAQLGAGAGAAVAGEATALADSIRDAVQHVEAAAHAVESGKLQQVIAEMRGILEADLDKLRGIHENAHDAPEEWRAARRQEHAELVDEVRTKLERIERIRGILWQILPRLQAVTRCLSAVQRALALEHRLEPQAAAGVEASKLTVVASLGAMWEVAFGDVGATASPGGRIRKRYIAAAVAVGAALVVGIVLATSGGKPAATPTTTATTPHVTPKPTLTPIAAVFTPSAPGAKCSPPACTTVYTESATGPGLHYTWSLSIPRDPGCAGGFKPNSPKPNQATWYHADATDGGPCNHAAQIYDEAGSGHPGVVTVTVTNAGWSCRDLFHGTQGPEAQPSATGNAPSSCRPVP